MGPITREKQGMTAAHDNRPRGVFAAALTPLQDDLSPDIGATIGHYRWLLDEGCDGIVCLGTTGEANSFSLDERLALLDALGTTDLPSKLVVGTGCCAVPDTVRLSKKAMEIGAAGVLVLPPFYYKGASDEGLYAAYAETIERIGDPALKLYIYHFPKMTAIDMGLELIGRLIAAYPDNVVGLKNSSGDWGSISSMIEAFPGFDVFAGTEEFLLPTLKLGGPGCMSATVNLLAPQSAEVYAKWRDDGAEALQEHLTTLRRTISRSAPIPSMKALLARQTGTAAWTKVRPPLVAIDAAQTERLAAELAGQGLELAAAA
jgi:4-hydroxy-tetrahydrodipicolinate synthase